MATVARTLTSIVLRRIAISCSLDMMVYLPQPK